jgi:hypothetical protein
VVAEVVPPTPPVVVAGAEEGVGAAPVVLPGAVGVGEPVDGVLASADVDGGDVVPVDGAGVVLPAVVRVVAGAGAAAVAVTTGVETPVGADCTGSGRT